ncbi:7-cyano-7-deazaguanine synthase [Clostridia bacterium]|nr:7-cyano-7-deazaguanine synthase [Clostridia bacterium]
MQNKLESLREYFSKQSGVAVAFSGGVDSTFLLKIAHDALADKCIAVTAASCSFPERELNAAKDFCVREGISHYIVDSEELDIDGFGDNPPDRCYLCKNELFTKIWSVAREHGISVVCEASNADDSHDYRPGLTAVKEQNVASPLRKIGFTKDEIRACSKELGLPTWNKQSFACLSSRFVYGEKISRDKLAKLDKAEQYLLDRGFGQVRVRVHGEDKLIARIEITPGEFDKLLAIRTDVSDYFKSVGFTFVSLDLTGYKTGSMNLTLPTANAD